MLKTNQVAFQYPSHGKGLGPTTLSIQPGELAVITGSSGSGKSTLARCMTGLIPHLYRGRFSGDVWLKGDKTSKLPLWELAERAGMVFQNPAAQMLAPSVEDEVVLGLENLGLERDEVTSRLEDVLIQFDLYPFRKRAPLSLSGGEQQKLALASILARRPEALVLDEPLSMLDITTATRLVEHLDETSKQGTTVAVFEHRKEYFSLVDSARLIPLNGNSVGTESPPPLKLPARAGFSLDINEITVALGSKVVLDKLSLCLPAGKGVAIVGRNGVGKTTLLRSISGLQKYTGNIQVISSEGNENLDMGIVFQNPDLQIFNPSVREEILYRIPDPDLDSYRNIISALGLGPYEATPPLLLSEGEKKRLALALVLMQKPAHGVLLDEPSLGQDQNHKDTLIRLLRTIADSGRLVVLTTHDLALASRADQIVLLGQDGVVSDGESSQVIQDRQAWEKAGFTLPAWFQWEEDLGASL